VSCDTYYIEILQKPLSDLVTARCLAARKQATSVTGHMIAVHACAKKIANGRQYTLRDFNKYTWLCDVSTEAATP
jgi:hypothetical protein